jgi:SAM-dependent methyltransferase
MADVAARLLAEVTGGSIGALLPDELQARLATWDPADVAAACANVLIRPQPLDVPSIGLALNNAALGAHWLLAFEELGLPRGLAVYEPGAGASEPVLLAAGAYSGGAGRYVTLNLNRPLAAELRAKLGNVKLDWTIIEDYAQLAAVHLAPASFDVACFHHAVNDILQTAVSEPRGLDTRDIDWWPNERQMIEWLTQDAAAGRLDECARPALLAAVGQAVTLVRPGGWLLFDHWTWEKYRNVAWFPWQLFTDLLPLARSWITTAAMPLREQPLTGRDPRWWMALRRE